MNGIDFKNSALVLIETQNEWMHPEGKLNKLLVTDKEMLEESIKNLQKTLDFARKNEINVVHVGLRFEKGYPELANGKYGLRNAIPKAGTFPINEFGSEFYETVKPLTKEFIVTGRTGASGFSGSNLGIYLRNNKIETLFLAGYATHVCVESTLREGHDKGYDCIVLSDSTSSFNRDQQEFTIKEIIHHFGKNMSTNEFLNL